MGAFIAYLVCLAVGGYLAERRWDSRCGSLLWPVAACFLAPFALVMVITGAVRIVLMIRRFRVVPTS